MTQQTMKEIENAREWGRMLAAPQTNITRAPSATPYLASKTRFVRSFDVKYSETRDGTFSVFMFPTPKMALLSNTAVAEHPLNDMQLDGIDDAKVQSTGYLDEETFVVSRADGSILGTTALGPIEVDATKRTGLNCTIAATNQITTKIKVTGDFAKLYWRVIAFNGAGVTESGAILDASVLTNYIATFAYTVRGLAVRVVDKTGQPLADYSKLTGTIKVDFSFAGSVQIPEKFVSYDLVQSSILDAGKIQSQRCTAMSMLVTNLAPPLSSGGEIVTARCLPGILNLSQPIAVAEQIKRLPEERYWRSGAIVDGAYTWWLPDNLGGYEPVPLVDVPNKDDNCLVASGSFSNDQGIVRVICTWIFEFYTPVQLFDRSYNTIYSDAHRRIFEEASRLPANSANLGHAALLASVFAAVSTVYNFYIKHEKAIDALANGVKSIVLSHLAARDNKPTKKQGQSSGRTVVNPQPQPRVQQRPAIVHAPKKPARRRRKNQKSQSPQSLMYEVD